MPQDRGAIKIDWSRFMGLYDRGAPGLTPERHSSRFENVVFDGDVVRQRNSFVKDGDFGGNIRRAISFKPSESSLERVLYLSGNDGEFRSSSDHAVVGTIEGATDFSAQSFNGRLYVTPHNGEEGLEEEFVYIWNGTDSFRKAAGERPSETFEITPTLLSGRTIPGIRIFGLIYQTDSGFLTRPGPEVLPARFFAGGTSLRITDIPAGPDHVVARHLVCTKAIREGEVTNGVFQGEAEIEEFFFIPGGSIQNNDDNEAVEVSFFDTELIENANDLFLNQEEIKAGLGICDYSGRMCIWNADGEPNIIRVSKLNNPESFSRLDGFVTIDVQDMKGVKNCWAFRDSLYVNKPSKTFITADNSRAPATWPVNAVDLGIGAEVNSVALINDTKGLNLDYTLVATRQGLLLFSGIYQHPEVSWKVETLWGTIPEEDLSSLQVLHNPAKRKVFICLPLGPENLEVGAPVTFSTLSGISLGSVSGEELPVGANSTEAQMFMIGSLNGTRLIKIEDGSDSGIFKILSRSGLLFTLERVSGDFPSGSASDLDWSRVANTQRKVLVCDYDYGWANPRWSLFSFETDVQGIVIIDGDLWIYGDAGLFKEEELDPQMQEFEGQLPIWVELGPFRMDEMVYSHGPLAVDGLKIESGFYSIRNFDEGASASITTVGEIDGRGFFVNYTPARKGNSND